MRNFFLVLLLCQSSLYMIAQNGVGSSLFTGRMTYSIPIYTIDDSDFHLDISLLYGTEGFRPFQPSNCLGQDWSLIAGGYVSRTVQGIADEWKYEYSSRTGMNDYKEYGFLNAFDFFEDIEEDFPNKNQVFNFDPTVCDTCGIYSREIWLGCQRLKIDYLPDIFHFNFCGHKGSFLINNLGDIVILRGDFVEVDLSKTLMNADNKRNAMDSPFSGSIITIKTMDGYTYTFGGNANALEYSVYTLKNTYELTQNTPSISAWYLTQIVAPNGRTLNFTYNSGENSNYGSKALKSFVTDYDWIESLNDTIHIVYSLHKECLLQSITTSDSIPLTITFLSHDEAEKKYNHNDFSMSKPHLQLDSIIVSYNGDVLKKATLSYQYRSTNNMFGAYPNYMWRYLNQVAISGTGKYRFAYNKVLFDIGNPNHHFYTTIYPGLYPQTDTEYKNMVDRWGFWKSTSLQGLLNEVTLPTGGKLKFTYGEHKYSEERHFSVVGQNDMELHSLPVANQTIGGARIEKIETFSEDNTLVESKTFSYIKPNSNMSSGVFYNFYEIFNLNNSTEGKPIANPFNYGILNSHIGYSHVQCTTTSGNQSYKTAYTFDTGNVSYSSYNNSTINRRTDISGYDSTNELLSGSLTYSARLLPTGKLLSIDQYKGNAIQKAIYFQYNGIENTATELPLFDGIHLGCIDTIVCLSRFSGLIARKLFVYPDVLEQIITYEYDSDGNAMMSKKNYSYDTKLRKREVVTTDNNGLKRFTRYAYPDDFIFSTWDVLFDPPAVYSLREIHRINTPVEQVSGYIENGEEYITSGTANLYRNIWVTEDLNNNAAHLPIRPDWDSISHVLDSIHHSLKVVDYYPYLYKTLRLSLTEPIPVSSYQWMNVNGTNIVYDSHYKLDCEYQFDIMDRLTSIKPFGATETKYAWNGLYPSSKTNGNQTTTYTYIPYVGVSSITDPRGTTTYYTYDASGRLIETYRLVEGKKQILNVYQYHIKTE